jgi:hypothetical protein
MNNGDCTVVTVGHGLHATRCEHAQLIVFLDSTTYHHHHHHHHCRVLSMTSVARGIEPDQTACGWPRFQRPGSEVLTNEGKRK